MCSRSRLLAVCVAAALPVLSAGAEPAADALARGDAAWARRASGHEGVRARPEPIEEAVAAYEEAWSDGEGDLEAAWKLLRALWFAGEYAARDETAKRARFDRGRAVSERAFERLAERPGVGRDLSALDPDDFPAAFPASDHAEVSRVAFWSAIVWGSWSRMHGLIATVRQGVADRLHRYALAGVALDPRVEGGGSQRLLSRLHAQLPRVPFVSGWVDRDEAIPWAERALAVDARHPGNHFLLAIAILETGSEERHPAAFAELEELSRLEPRPDAVLEDLSVREEARKRLRSLAGDAPAPPGRAAAGPQPESDRSQLWTSSVRARSSSRSGPRPSSRASSARPESAWRASSRRLQASAAAASEKIPWATSSSRRSRHRLATSRRSYSGWYCTAQKRPRPERTLTACTRDQAFDARSDAPGGSSTTSSEWLVNASKTGGLPA